MTKVPVKFKKMAAAIFNEAARVRLCESSGSEHFSPDDDLSDLVNSFIERDDQLSESDIIQINHDDQENYSNTQDAGSCFSGSESKNRLEGLLNSGEHLDEMVKKIRAETEIACGKLGERSSQGFHRRLMSHLRDLGFDAGLCKSRWEKFGKYPAGDYEFVDVIVDGERWIIEVRLASEFEIARPTSDYTALLDVFPRVFIGRPEDMKKIVRLMCSAISRSMKKMLLHVPPWRKNGYMQAKWMAPYKRTTNGNFARKRLQSDESFSIKRSIGFEAFPGTAHTCRSGNFAAKIGLKAAYLSAVFDGH